LFFKNANNSRIKITFFTVILKYRRLIGVKWAWQEQGIIIVSIEKEKNQLKKEFFLVHHRIVSAVKRVDFDSDRVTCGSERSLV
jgi:hypothetical protein